MGPNRHNMARRLEGGGAPTHYQPASRPAPLEQAGAPLLSGLWPASHIMTASGLIYVGVYIDGCVSEAALDFDDDNLTTDAKRRKQRQRRRVGCWLAG